MNPEIQECLLCHWPQAARYPIHSHDLFRIQCARCGEYLISREFVIFSDVRESLSEVAYILSGLSRELKESSGQHPEILLSNYINLSKQYPVPDVNDIDARIEKFLQQLKRMSPYYGKGVRLHLENDFPLAYAKNSEEFIAIIKLLVDSKYITVSPQSNVKSDITLTHKGWGVAQKLQTQVSTSKQGFVAIWFDDSMDESIAAIESAIKENGYQPICIKGEFFSEKIMDKALGEIRKSRFLVVDLTESRGSVFFEAGFALGLNIEAIYVYKKSSKKSDGPWDFYLKHYQCHEYTTSAELHTIVKNAISARIAKARS